MLGCACVFAAAPEEGQHVVFAQAEEFDIFHHHHFIILRSKNTRFSREISRVLVQGVTRSHFVFLEGHPQVPDILPVMVPVADQDSEKYN